MQKKIKRWTMLLFLTVFLFCLAGCGSSQVTALRLEGIDLLERGKYEEAAEILDQALKAGKGSVSKEQFDILKYRAEAEYMLGRYDTARETLAILRQLDGEREEYDQFEQQIETRMLVRRIKEALDRDALEEARALLDQAAAEGLSGDRDVVFDEVVYLEKTAKWQEAYDALSAYVDTYQATEEMERELQFLKTRVDALRQNTLRNAES